MRYRIYIMQNFQSKGVGNNINTPYTLNTTPICPTVRILVACNKINKLNAVSPKTYLPKHTFFKKKI